MLGNLVLDMLTLAKDSKPAPFPTDINDLTEQVCTLVKDRAAELNTTINCITAANLTEVTLDPTNFYRCLLNLVSNAIEACAENGSITVRVYRAEGRDRFTVSVQDNGSGISSENRRKLFTEFFTTKGGRGTGLGLHVTLKLIHEMKGIIKYHSIPDHGTRFVFALPITNHNLSQEAKK